MVNRGRGGRRNQRPNRAQHQHKSTTTTTTILAASASVPEELSGTTLPDELILEVLYRTPVKTLVTFRCVSKSWLALTFDPRFISMHLSHNALTNKHTLYHAYATDYKAKTLTLLHNVNEPPTHLYVLKPSQPRKLDYPRKFNFPNFFKEMVFCGSINGIVCLSHSQHPDSCYFVEWGRFCVLWNPAMNCCKTIKLPAKKTILDMWELVSVGFGFDADGNDYKIIRIVPVSYPPSSNENIMSRVEIYSAKKDSWKDINGGALIPFCPGLPNCNFVIKGVPYWHVWGRENYGLGVIDPRTGMHREIPYPDYVKNQRTDAHPVNLLDSISLLIYSPGQDPNHLVDVYVLDETCGQWTKKYTTQPIVAEGLRLPQCLTTGQIVVETWEGGDSDHRCTFFYDPSTSRLSAKFDASNTLWYQSYSHVESLVCLKGMEPLEKEAKEDKKKKKKPKTKNWDGFLSEGFELVLRFIEV